MRKVTKTAAGAMASLLATGWTTLEAAPDCDRDCLIDIADGYLGALAARDPRKAPLSPDIAFVENVTRLEPGKGLWASAAGPATDFRIYVPDPEQSTIGLITVIDRETVNGVVRAQLALRLKIEDRKITEAEHLVADVPSAADPLRLKAPRPNLVAVVPERERVPHDDLARIAGSYYEALDKSDGTLAPFADDCEREENALITAGPGLPPAPFDSVDVKGRPPPAVARDCAGQMSSRRFAYIDSIDHRRIFAVDPVQGLAMGFSHFRQSMSQGPLLMIAADGSHVMWQEKRDPYDLPAAHVFKITGGKIHEVEAVGIFVPYNSPTGWE